MVPFTWLEDNMFSEALSTATFTILYTILNFTLAGLFLLTDSELCLYFFAAKRVESCILITVQGSVEI